jgi:hypothetical protein
MTTNFFSPLSFVAVFGSGIRDPGSGMGKNQDPGSGINIPDPQHWCEGCVVVVVRLPPPWFELQIFRLPEKGGYCTRPPGTTSSLIIWVEVYVASVTMGGGGVWNWIGACR